MFGWLATILDPRFKSLAAASSSMRNEVIQELRKRINLSTTTLLSSNLPDTSLTAKSDMASFFDDEVELSSSPVDIELQVYFSILQIPKYELTDSLYKKHNSLTW